MKVSLPQFNFPFEIFKAYEDENKWIIEGYAATSDFDLQEDVILPSALKTAAKDLKKNSTVFFNHDRKRPIGRVLDSKFVKTKTGAALKVRVLISKTAPDIWQQIKEGVLNKFSIAAKVIDAEKKFVAKLGRIANVIKNLFLLEASLVALPANPQARTLQWYVSKALKDFEGQGGKIPMKKEELLDLEEILKQEEEEAGEGKLEEEEDDSEELKEENSGGEGEEKNESEETKEDSEETDENSENQEEKKEEQTQKTEKQEEADKENEGKETKKYRYPYSYPYPYPYPRRNGENQNRENRNGNNQGEVYPYPYAYPPVLERSMQNGLGKIFFILDKLIQGTMDKKAVPVLQELKGIISHMFGGTYPYPSPYPYPKPQSQEKDVREIVKEEISKSLNLRKGLTEVEESKTSENMDPSDKLRNILSDMER